MLRSGVGRGEGALAVFGEELEFDLDSRVGWLEDLRGVMIGFWEL